jgi:hypothetical protein
VKTTVNCLSWRQRKEIRGLTTGVTSRHLRRVTDAPLSGTGCLLGGRGEPLRTHSIDAEWYCPSSFFLYYDKAGTEKKKERASALWMANLEWRKGAAGTIVLCGWSGKVVPQDTSPTHIPRPSVGSGPQAYAAFRMARFECSGKTDGRRVGSGRKERRAGKSQVSQARRGDEGVIVRSA